MAGHRLHPAQGDREVPLPLRWTLVGGSIDSPGATSTRRRASRTIVSSASSSAASSAHDSPTYPASLRVAPSAIAATPTPTNAAPTARSPADGRARPAGT